MTAVSRCLDEAALLDITGLVSGVTYIPSPNCDDRPEGTVVSLIVIHAISLPPGEFGGDGVIQLFTNRLVPGEHPYYAGIHTLRVSAHFLIRRDGAVIQFVPCEKRAWHAGVSVWRERECCNDFSVGIELEGCDDRAFEEAQYRSLAALLALIKHRYPCIEVAGHSEIAAGRKTDPGPCFDWSRVRQGATIRDRK